MDLLKIRANGLPFFPFAECFLVHFSFTYTTCKMVLYTAAAKIL